MRKRRLLLFTLSGLALGTGLTMATGGCGDDEPDGWDEQHPDFPIPPAPPMPPEPPGAPGEHGRALATHYFELEFDGEDRLVADLELALGRVETARAESGYLFQTEVMLPQGQMRPRFAGRSAGGTAHVSLNLDDAALSPRGVRRAESAMWRVYLPTETPTDLSMKLGATQALLDLTGIPISNLELDAGLSRADLRFGEPNPVEMEQLSIDAGLAEFRADGLGNARFHRLSFDGGAGRFSLDFSGEDLASDAIADIDVGMADLLVTLPSGQAIILETPESAFVSVRVPDSFTREHSGWWSPEVDDADDAFRLTVESGPGRVEVRLAR